jgi:hypothetical protein
MSQRRTALKRVHSFFYYNNLRSLTHILNRSVGLFGMELMNIIPTAVTAVRK